MNDLRKEIENILRGQFVDRAYTANGHTTWGVDENTEKLLDLFKRWALEMVGEDEEHDLNCRSRADEPHMYYDCPTQGMNIEKELMRDRINQTGEDTSLSPKGKGKGEE